MYHKKSVMTDLSKFQVLLAEWMAEPMSSLFPQALSYGWRLLEQKLCFPRPSHRHLWHKLIQDLCFFLRYFLHIKEPFLSPYIWGKGKKSNEWKVSSTHISRIDPNTSTRTPPKSNHRNRPLRIKSKLYIVYKTLWSGPWMPLLPPYTTVANWIFLQYSSILSLFLFSSLCTYFLFPLPGILCPLTFAWLISGQISPL